MKLEIPAAVRRKEVSVSDDFLGKEKKNIETNASSFYEQIRKKKERGKEKMKSKESKGRKQERTEQRAEAGVSGRVLAGPQA